MRVGIDAKWFFHGPPSGRVVVRNLVEQLADLGSDDQFFIFLDRRESSQAFPFESPKLRPVYVWADNNLIANVFVVPWAARNLDLDVLVFQFFPSLRSKFRRIAFVHDVFFLSHPQYYSMKERLYFFPLRFLVRSVEGLCTVSESEKRRLIQYGLKDSTESVRVVYLGVSSEFRPLSQLDGSACLAVTKKFGLPHEYLLYVGRLNIRKNIENLLRALPLMQHREIPLIIVGEPDWRMRDIGHLLSRPEIRDRVMFIGAVYGDELPYVMAMARVFCFPSLAESFGLPPLESMAAGVPVVISKGTSLEEICAEAGEYVNPICPEEIASAIDRLLDDKRLYLQRVDVGMRRAMSFSWQNSARQLLDYVHEIGKSL